MTDILISMLPLLLIGGLLGFWIAMFIHAINYEIPDKALYIIVLIIGGPFVGSPVYYFAVYKKYRKKK